MNGKHGVPKVTSVVERALQDPVFAEGLKSMAFQAIKQGVGSQEWLHYMKHFAETPEELALMSTPTAQLAARTTTTISTISVTMTTLTTTTVVCTTTTTTSTTSVTTTITVGPQDPPPQEPKR